VAEEVLSYEVDLTDLMSEPAHKAADAVDQLGEHSKKAKDHLAELTGGLLKTIEPTEVLRHSFESAGEGLKEFKEGLASGEVKGMVSGLADTLAGLSQSLDLLVPGLGQVASAAIKVGGAFAAMTVGIIQSGVEMALEVTSVNEKLEATFDALGYDGPESGKKTITMLNELAGTLPQSRDQLAQWTKQFEALGVTDLDELRNQLKATASAQAIMGDVGAQAYTTITKKVQEAIEAHHGLKLSEKSLTALYNAGVNVTDISDKLGITTAQLAAQLKKGTLDAESFGNALETTLIEKGKKPLEAMENELGVLKTKGLETLNHLFDDIDTKPLTDAIKSVIQLGDQGEPSGQVLKDGVTAGINGVIRAIGHGITEAEIFFLKLEVYALELELKLKPIVNLLERMGVLSKENATPQWGGNGLAPGAPGSPGGPPAPEFKTGLTVTRDAGLAGAEGLALGGPVGGPLIAAALALGTAITGALDIGVQNDINKVRQSGWKVGDAAIQGAKERLDAHSPSRVFMDIGANAGVGLGMGLQGSRAHVERGGYQAGGFAVGGLQAGLYDHHRERPFGYGRSEDVYESRGGGKGVHIEHLDVTIMAPNGVTNATEISANALARVLERYQLGAGR
jgi:hypothetical protein